MSMTREPSGTEAQKECKNEHQYKRELANAAQSAAGLFNDDGRFKNPEDAAFMLIRPINEKAFRTSNPQEREIGRQLESKLQDFVVGDSIRKASAAIDGNGNVADSGELLKAYKRLEEKKPELFLMLEEARKNGKISPENFSTLKGLAKETVAPQDYILPQDDLNKLREFAKHRHEDFSSAVDSCLAQKGLPVITRNEKGQTPW